jgi:serine/threonine-protein kinase
MALEKIGPYKFQGVLGRGGMGTVYRGKHNETDEIHAVKILAPTYAHDPHFRRRFESEIKALLKLDHPNIVRLLSYGQEDAMLYFAMELVEGNSLFQMQRRGHRFQWREILSIASDVAKGLRHAHDRGVIHRDLKPGNLLVEKDESGKPSLVKITDFGIAKRFGSAQITGNNVLGTMDFMSPEQAKGEPVTIKSDLYSLGTVLFTLLSGKPPFSANSVEESLRNLTRVPAPRISTMVPDVPRELDDLIKRLMSKKPDNRVPTAQALIHQIEEVEGQLRDYSEAKTAQRKPEQPRDDTFDIKAPRTIQSTSVKSKGGRGEGTLKGIDATDANAPATIDSLDDGGGILDPATQVDYYNPVTDQLRKKSVDLEIEDQPTKSSGVLPLVLALAAVVALGTYGVIQAYAPPTAEALFAEIEANGDFPNRSLDEIELFLKHYPNEPRVEQVIQMQKIAEAIDLYNGLSNTLKVRRNLPGENRLTPIEKQFMEIVDLAQDNPTKADAKMNAFIRLNEKLDLEPSDRKCVEAAASYRVKLKYDSKTGIMFKLKQIRAAMSEAEKTTDPVESMSNYANILELYGDVEWGVSEESKEGRSLVLKARQLYLAMRGAKEKADREKAEAEKEAARIKAEEEKAAEEKAAEEKSSNEAGDASDSNAG